MQPAFFSALVVTLMVLTSISPSRADTELVGLPPDPDARPDFSGSWEKDYRRSDEWEKQIQLKVSEIRRQAERQSSDRQSGAGPTINLSNQRGGGTSIIDLARFTELISRYNDIHITQTEHEVRISREGEPDLICGLDDKPMVSSANDFGSELCMWNNHQLIFKVSLPDRISILYRFVVSPDRQSLNLLTRVSSNNELSFDLVQFFNHYEAPQGQYDCRQTLTRGKVCSKSRGALD